MLTAVQRQKLPRLFDMYDADHNGVLEWADFERLLKAYTAVREWPPGDSNYDTLQSRFRARWQHMLHHADANRDHGITLEEWLTYMDDALNDPVAYQAELHSIASLVFSIFDLDGDGGLNLNEYGAWFRVSGLDEGAARAMFDRLGLSAEGSISLSEFSKLFEQFFQGQDADAPGNWVFGG